jgi:O-antigen/teichoic acid export membrane protein
MSSSAPQQSSTVEPPGSGREPSTSSPGAKRQLLGHGAVYVIGTIAQSGLALLLLPLATRVLDVEQFGLAGTASALAALLAIVYGLGLNFAIVRFYYDAPKNAHRAGWAALLRAQAAVALALATVTYLTGPWWASLFGSVGWTGAFKFAVALAWFSALQATTQGVLRAAQRPIAFIIVALVQVLVGIGAGIGLAVSFGAAGYVAGLCAGSAVAATIGVVLTYKRPRWSPSELLDGLTLSLPGLLHQASNWGMEAADRLLVAAYLGLSAVGRYQVAYVIGGGLALLLTGMQSAWVPYFIGNLNQEARRVTAPQIIVPIAVVASMATAILVLAAPALLAVVAPSAFGGTEMVVALVAAATPARAAYFMAVAVLLDRRSTGRMATASLTAVAVNIGMNLILIPRFGLIGAAVATAVSVDVQALLILLMAQRLVGLGMHIGRLSLIWGAGTGMLVAFACIPNSAAGLVLKGLLGAAVLGAGWLALRWLARAFNSSVTDPVMPTPA